MDLRYVINHVFLPPKLPQKSDSAPQNDRLLTDLVHDTLKDAATFAPGESCWAALSSITDMLLAADDSGMLPDSDLVRALGSMKYDSVLTLHIESQNAGVIIRRLQDKYVFESFELSPTTEAVVTTKGRLVRSFPGPAIAVHSDRVDDVYFRKAFAQCVLQLKLQVLAEACPTARKGKTEIVEVRQTINPKYVTEMLTGILRAVGEPHEVVRIWKYTRDDVLWNSAFEPWRRSPRWLLLRVALQTSLMEVEESKIVHSRYKFFMVLLMAKILDEAVLESISGESLFIMSAKISRRMLKLGRAADDMPWLNSVRNSVKSAHHELQRRWMIIQQNPDPADSKKISDLKSLLKLSDTHLKLDALRIYLGEIHKRQPTATDPPPDIPPCGQRIYQDGSCFPDIDLLYKNASEPSRLWMLDLEAWIRDHLQDWLTVNLLQTPSKQSCRNLKSAIALYLETAYKAHHDDPENLSVMILTLMDMWVALDICTIAHEPFLKEYPTGFPSGLFNTLLLPKKDDLYRLFRIEQYLRMRAEEVDPRFPSLFLQGNTQHCFAVKYFDQSPELQQLKIDIETAAVAERAAKVEELSQLKTLYNSKMDQSGSMPCSFRTVPRGKSKQQMEEHDPNCGKCRIKKDAAAMYISIHEWPLPSKDVEAKAAVFELDVPEFIWVWRECTYEILVNLLTPIYAKPAQPEDKYTLHGFAGLERWISSPTGRLQLASHSKEFSRSHYKSQKVSVATKEAICVPNGLHCIMYDSVSYLWTHDILGRHSLERNCTLKLPSGSYQSLQYALSGTEHTSNEVLSRQDVCPESITLHEFYSFVTLRSGHRLQWRNIARELVSKILNFNHVETRLLMLQAAYEAGPPNGTPIRDSHIDLEEEEFGLSLISALNDALSSVESNWQGASAVRVFTALGLRVLSLSKHKSVHNRCFQFLDRTRGIVLQWIHELVDLLHATESEDELRKLTVRVLELSLTCHETFDVDMCHLSNVLASAENVSILIECAITIHKNCPTGDEGVDATITLQLARFHRRSNFLEAALREHIVADIAGIDLAIGRLWPAYTPGGEWTAMSWPSERWMFTTLFETNNQPRMTLHLNLLDGNFLVNGVPLSRLPRAYEMHKTYRRIFGRKVLEVVPSQMPGMAFESRRKIYGHQVHFKLHDGELIIKARKNGDEYELLPLRAVRGDLPRSFTEDYIHWLDYKYGSIEWRPVDSPWKNSPNNWQTCSHGFSNFSLLKDSWRLVESQSSTAKAIYQILSPLEEAQHIHIMQNFDVEILEVYLPRMNLDFFIDNGSCMIESKQFRGMVIDANQSFGCLNGLINKIVLREAAGPSRIVLIPDGVIHVSKNGDHVTVSIDIQSKTHVSYHQFQIDSLLGRLVDNGSLRSRLFRIYLHAVTSYCLPDDLTSRTGTEEALHTLSQASTQSFDTFDRLDVELLDNIAFLSPSREYYPEHLRTMEKIVWRKVPTLQQHEKFFQIVEAMKLNAASLQPFQEVYIQTPKIKVRDHIELYERASIRCSSIRGDGFGAEKFTTRYDSLYASRDRIDNPDREGHACSIAKHVDEWSPNSKPYPGLLLEFESWRASILGDSSIALPSLGFDSQWLGEPAEIFPSSWCTLYKRLQKCDYYKDKYKVMFFLSTLAYSPHADLRFVQVLLAVATVPEIQMLKIPAYESFNLIKGYSPSIGQLRVACTEHIFPFEKSEAIITIRQGANTKAERKRRRKDYLSVVDAKLHMLVQYLINQWPAKEYSFPEGSEGDEIAIYIDLEHAAKDIQDCFREWHRNGKFRDYIDKVQAIIGIPADVESTPVYVFKRPRLVARSLHLHTHITFKTCLCNIAPIPNNESGHITSLQNLLVQDLQGSHESLSLTLSESYQEGKLTKLLSRLSLKADGMYENTYLSDLQHSYHAFQQQSSKLSVVFDNADSLLQKHLDESTRIVKEMYEDLCSSLLVPLTSGHELCHLASVVPRLSPSIILSQLGRDKFKCLQSDWKSAIVQYGIAITALQHAERLKACLHNRAEVVGELINPSHVGWDPLDYPDWLLLELENNILIREEQAQIAKQMISPSSWSNSIMQLNMGLGKSSVIVPIVASTLADGSKLARVVVLKSLSTQMFQLLQNKLGGMIDRRIYYLPISRSLKLDQQLAVQIRKIYTECLTNGGVLLVQPEHMLSFELLGLDRALSTGDGVEMSDLVNDCISMPPQDEVGMAMIKTQEWLVQKSRDILDESDEILSARFELIYTMGSQRPTEFSPQRWQIIQNVLGVLAKEAVKLSAAGACRNGMEVLRAKFGDGFPRIRILHQDAGIKLLTAVAQEICENGLPGLSVWNLPRKARGALYKFLTYPTMAEAETALLQSSVLSDESMKSGLLLLRGLFVAGILSFAFAQKRWRVNYGLHLVRTRLAVPYQAKDSPSARAEFSHPDTTIVLTCLSYYYGGLSDQQIYESFDGLLQSDHPQEQYQEWIRFIPNMPNAFRQLSGVNLSNTAQCSRDLFPLVRFSKALIDFHMSHLVFPKEMKEFSHKLSSSGWDIARDKNHPTTGFSGTNDSKYILPVPIRQSDLPQQLHTNAAVLDCLLRPENTVDSTFTNGVEVLDADVLLQMAVKSDPHVRVILDVGAQVLELRNEEVARKWLSMVPTSNAQVAIYVDDRNDLCVISRTGLKELLLVSPYAKLMDRCLVYLDEAHTRGTDLKMPADYRAIVTLGPDLTKDRLAQACMRLRKLGKGQSVCFAGSLEIQLKILHCNDKKAGDIIEVADVLAWCIQNTWQSTKKSLPLWATQGVRHYRRRAACATDSGLPVASSSIFEPEAQSLEQRYGFDGDNSEERDVVFANAGQNHLGTFSKELEAIREKCREFGLLSFQGSPLHEEQERELQPENEREQQVERPLPLFPRSHFVHASVTDFVKSGDINRFSTAFIPAFMSLSNTSAATACEASAWPQDLLVTADFAQTVVMKDDRQMDQYIRPVHWVLILRRPSKFPTTVIISPQEANALLPIIREKKNVTLHVYTPRSSLANPTLEDLAFCAIPPLPADWVAPPIGTQINLFAGQLYLRSYEEYLALCRFLGLCSKAPGDNVRVAVDGFVLRDDRANLDTSMARYCRFETSPIPFLRALFVMRRKGQGFASSHLGRMLNGELLNGEHFVNLRQPRRVEEVVGDGESAEKMVATGYENRDGLAMEMDSEADLTTDRGSQESGGVKLPLPEEDDRMVVEGDQENGGVLLNERSQKKSGILLNAGGKESWGG